MLTLDELRRIAFHDPDNLPRLFVHPNHEWPGPPRVDANADVRLCEADFLKLSASLPLQLVGKVKDRPGVTEYRIDLQPHHLVPGLSTRGRPAETHTDRRKETRGAIGLDREDGTVPAPKPKSGVLDLLGPTVTEFLPSGETR